MAHPGLTYIIQLVVLFLIVKDTYSHGNLKYDLTTIMITVSRAALYKSTETECYVVQLRSKITRESSKIIACKVEYPKLNQIIIDKNGAILDAKEIYKTVKILIRGAHQEIYGFLCQIISCLE